MPQRPVPLSQSAGQQPVGQAPLQLRTGSAAWAGPQAVPAAPTTPAVPSKPRIPTAPKPAEGDVERRIPAAPRRPEMPVSSPLSPGAGTVTGDAPLGGARLPMTGPQPGQLGGADAMLPPGATGGTAAMPSTVGAGPQTPFSPVGSGAILPQPTAGGARPIVLPTPEGGQVRLREPTKVVGSGDDTLELRSRSSVEKEKWRFKKNLILWAFGLFILGLTIIILMMLGPIEK
jgi:hypothetical protein